MGARRIDECSKFQLGKSVSTADDNGAIWPFGGLESSLHQCYPFRTRNTVFGENGEVCLGCAVPRGARHIQSFGDRRQLLRLCLRGAAIRLYCGQRKMRLNNDHPDAITWECNVTRRQINCFDVDHWIPLRYRQKFIRSKFVHDRFASPTNVYSLTGRLLRQEGRAFEAVPAHLTSSGGFTRAT
jgi:hypothetical protein